MTPKEKATELFDKYWELNTDFDGLVKYELAKQCALIAVDEILIYCSDIYDREFMEKVKKEIEAL